VSNNGLRFQVEPQAPQNQGKRQNRGHDERKTSQAHSREICPGGVGFEARSASGGRGAVLVANLTRPILHGVRVRVIGIQLGLKISKLHDKHVNANGETTKKQLNARDF